MKPGRQQKRKQWCQDLCLKVHYAQCFVLTHVLCMNYIIQTFPLVSKRTNFLFCARLKPKKIEQSTCIKTKTFVEFNSHSPWSWYRIWTQNELRLTHTFAGAVHRKKIKFVPAQFFLGNRRKLEISSSKVTVFRRWRQNDRMSFQWINQPSNVLCVNFSPLLLFIDLPITVL